MLEPEKVTTLFSVVEKIGLPIFLATVLTGFVVWNHVQQSKRIDILHNEITLMHSTVIKENTNAFKENTNAIQNLQKEIESMTSILKENK